MFKKSNLFFSSFPYVLNGAHGHMILMSTVCVQFGYVLNPDDSSTIDLVTYMTFDAQSCCSKHQRYSIIIGDIISLLDIFRVCLRYN